VSGVIMKNISPLLNQINGALAAFGLE